MNVNVSETKEYYHSLTEALMCDCDYCRNYRLKVKSAFPKVAMYLDSLGIDIEKPFETSPLELMKMECWNIAVVSISYWGLANLTIITELTR